MGDALGFPVGEIHPFTRIRLEVRQPRTSRWRLARKLWRIENQLPIEATRGGVETTRPDYREKMKTMKIPTAGK